MTAPDVYDLLVVYGQSNALGEAGVSGFPVEAPDPLPSSLMFDPTDGQIKPMSNTMRSANGEDSTGNAWTAFANQYHQDSGRGLVVVNGARGGQPIMMLLPGGVTELYQNMVLAARAAIARMEQQELRIGRRYLVYHQGEHDQMLCVPGDAYHACLLAIMDAAREDLGLSLFGVCTVGTPQQERWATRACEPIQRAQREAVASRPFAALLFDGCPDFSKADGTYGPEGLHYTQQGYNLMGSGAAKTLCQLLSTIDAPIDPILAAESGQALDERCAAP